MRQALLYRKFLTTLNTQKFVEIAIRPVRKYNSIFIKNRLGASKNAVVPAKAGNQMLAWTGFPPSREWQAG